MSVYEVAKQLKKLFTEFYENDEEFYRYLLERDFPSIVEYVEVLVKKEILPKELKKTAIEYLILSLVDMNNSLYVRTQLYEQGSEYFPQWQYNIQPTVELVKKLNICLRRMCENCIIFTRIPWYFPGKKFNRGNLF